MRTKDRNIAVLITCHNRKETTSRCLESLELESRVGVGEWTIDIFLVDDGSTDGTGESVKELFHPPCIYTSNLHLIPGNGNLFWARGMHLAWQAAIEATYTYDYFLWLNDDVELKPGAIEKLVEVWRELGDERSVIVGACSSDESERVCSYGITDVRNELVAPNGKVTRCEGWFTGNCVLVPRKAYEEVGMISDEYTHARADYDYAERLKRAGIPVYGSSEYVGVCVNDFDKKMRGKSLWTRIRMLWTPGYYNLHDMFIFRMKYYGFARAVVSCLHLAALAIKGVRG